MERNILNGLIADSSESNATTRRGSVKKRLLLFACVSACCVVSVLGVRAYNSKGPAPNRPRDYNSRAFAPVPLSQPGKQSLAQASAADKRGLHGIVFTLYPVGIEPASLHTTKGLVSISIEDHSGGTAGLVIERETGNAKVSLGQVTRDLNHWRGGTEMRLEPGRYRVFDSSRPDNDAELIVDP